MVWGTDSDSGNLRVLFFPERLRRRIDSNSILKSETFYFQMTLSREKSLVVKMSKRQFQGQSAGIPLD